MKLLLAICSILSLLAEAVPAQGHLWTVDDDVANGPDFTEIHAAVAFAASGDTLLVADGTYRSFAIDGKSLAVLADGDDVRIQEVEVPTGGLATTVEVRNLAADQAVVIKGLSLSPKHTVSPLPPATLIIENNAGDVWIEDVHASSNYTVFGSPDLPTSTSDVLRIQDSDSVTLARSTFSAVQLVVALLQSPGNDTARAEASNVALYDCAFESAPHPPSPFGAPPCTTAAAKAGTGFTLVGGTLFASGCAFEGGQGGIGQNDVGLFGGTLGGPGGDGLRVEGVGASVTTRDCTFAGGAGGAGGLQASGTPCPAGADGSALASDVPVTALPGPALPFDVTSPLRLGEVGFFSYSGSPGDLALILVSPSQGPPIPLAGPGTIVIGPVVRTFALGSVPGSGALDVPLSFHSVGRDDFRTFYVQGLVLTAGTELLLTSPASLTVLAAGF